MRKEPRRAESLVLDVQRTGEEPKNLERREDTVALLHIVMKEDFESRVLDWFLDYVVTIRIEFEPRRTPTVHVHHHLYLRRWFYRGGVENHLTREAMDDQNFRREVLVLGELVQGANREVHVVTVHLADFFPGDKPLALIVHRELGIDGEVHIRSRKKGKE